MDDLSGEERAKLRLPADQMALQLKHVGQYGEHALAKKAGFLKDDILLSVDGRTQRLTESELFAYILQSKPPGAKLPALVLRGGQRLNLEIPTQ
jgi:S1-C subfamily serine protease